MFGRRDLSKVGIRAYADVLAAEQSAISVSLGNPNLVNNTEVRWKLLLRVTPDAEPPFEVNVNALLPQLSQPRPGTRLPVLYDPKDHSRVQIDPRPAATADAAIDAVTAARPDLAGAQVMGMPMTDVIRQAIADPTAFRQEMMRRGAEMQQQALGAVQAAQTQQTADPVDRLERLAALKDRGLLTDDEFEQQKRKILGE
ncbi:SHOCT domain-containing protein [Mycobacterium seoulense]|uniref:SHOCT domain-containing protein n=1 Tax=Mycobacterium seoulense TaxID=386911 RepID=UPI003CF44AC2